MKRLYFTILASLALLLVCSCQEQEPIVESPVITVKASDLKIPAKGGNATIEFITDDPFTVTLDKEWCSYSIDGMVATFTAAANESFESRYAKAIVKAGDETLDFTIQQFGFYSSGFEPSDIKTSSDAAVFDFPYEYEDKMVVETDAEWITFDVAEDNLKVFVAENTQEGTPDTPFRYAEIAWTLGYDKGIIKVAQNNLSFMKVDDNWDVHYDGVHDYEGEPAAFISNDVADPTISGKYGIYVALKSDFIASGMEMNDFVTVVADDFRAEIQEVIELYAALLGIELTFSDFLYEESDFEIFSPFDPGEYIAFAIGFNDAAEATGHYAFSDFTVETGGGGGATGYEAWLGEWEVKRGSETDTWKITADEEGATYVITGIEGRDYPVAATYLPDTEGLEVRAQAEIGTYSSSNYGECSVGIYGGWDESMFATGTYVIFTGKISDGKATLTPNTISLTDGTSHLLERVQYIAATSDGKYLTISKDKTLLPATLTKKGGSGEGGGDESDAYSKRLGSWSVGEGEGAFEISITKNVANKSMYMRGWQFTEAFFEDSEVTFESDGTITLYGDTSTPLAANVDIGVPEGPCDLFYVGFFPDGSQRYYLSDSEKYAVATGTLQGDGSATYTGLEFQLSDGNTYKFSTLEIIAIPMSDPDGGAYTWKGCPEFPLTSVKMGSSSVKTTSFGCAAAGMWEKVEAKKIEAEIVDGIPYEFCTPHQAVPEIPVRYKRHVKTN